MVLYTTSTCPKCKVIKMKMEKAGLKYEACEDMSVMEPLGIKSVPQLQLDNGQLLDFNAIVTFLRTLEVNK